MDKRSRFNSNSSLIKGMLLAVVIFSFGVASAQGPEIKQARRYVELDQINKAITTLTEAVAKYPQDPDVNYQLGLAQIKANQLDQALATFEKGIKINEKDGQNLAGKGHVLLLKDNASEAQALFTKALALSKSKDPKTLKAVATAKLTKAANADEVIMLAKKALSAQEKDEQSYNILGEAYQAKNNGGLAVSNFEYAASANPKSGYPHYRIGMVYMRAKNDEAAEAAFKKAIEVDPEYTLAHKELGELYYSKNKAADAVKAYENYLRLSENSDEGQFKYAFYLFAAKDYAKANDIFSKLAGSTKTDPKLLPLVLRYWAYSLSRAGKLEESRSVFDKYFAAALPADIIATDYVNYAETLVKLGLDSLAPPAYRQAIKRDTTSTGKVELQRTLAELFFKLKKYDSAIVAYKQLFKNTPQPMSKDLYSLGRAQYQKQQFVDADTTFQKLAIAQPTMGIAVLWVARTNTQMDPDSEKGLAKPWYEKFISMVPPDQVEKSKNDLIEAHSYLAYYHFIKSKFQDSLKEWEIVRGLDPKNERARIAIDAIKNGQKQPKK
jgi:tetratricopeptide (TPR) repeat protein